MERAPQLALDSTGALRRLPLTLVNECGRATAEWRRKLLAQACRDRERSHHQVVIRPSPKSAIALRPRETEGTPQGDVPGDLRRRSEHHASGSGRVCLCAPNLGA